VNWNRQPCWNSIVQWLVIAPISQDRRLPQVGKGNVVGETQAHAFRPPAQHGGDLIGRHHIAKRDILIRHGNHIGPVQLLGWHLQGPLHGYFRGREKGLVEFQRPQGRVIHQGCATPTSSGSFDSKTGFQNFARTSGLWAIPVNCTAPQPESAATQRCRL